MLYSLNKRVRTPAGNEGRFYGRMMTSNFGVRITDGSLLFGGFKLSSILSYEFGISLLRKGVVNFYHEFTTVPLLL